MRFRIQGRKKHREIDPDEILLDSANAGEFDLDQFEGRIERPLGRRSFIAAGALMSIFALLLLGRAADLQIVQGTAYAKQARENQLEQKVIFADRGAIDDRAGRHLAWNERKSVELDYATRTYSAYRGLGHAIGYVKAPAKDSSGFYYRDTYTGVDGAEKAFDGILKGENGLTLTETDARGNVVSEAKVSPPAVGSRIILSIDAAVNQGLFDAIGARARDAGAVGGAGVIIDVRTGELLAMTSYPEYSPEAMVSGYKATINAYTGDKRLPFLNRATDGLYAPGSIVKPLIAAAAINEGVIDEYKQILSTGKLVVPNPYDPDNPTIFKDWRVNGWTDMRRAIAVSSDVYFYEVGGGLKASRASESSRSTNICGASVLEPTRDLQAFPRPLALYRRRSGRL